MNGSKCGERCCLGNAIPLVVFVVVFALSLPAASLGDDSAWVPTPSQAAVQSGGWAVPREAAIHTESCGDSGITLRSVFPGVQLSVKTGESGVFTVVECPKAMRSGVVGRPDLPTVRRLFIVPHGGDVSLAVSADEPVIVDLAAQGLPVRVMPFQPLPVSELSDTPAGSEPAGGRAAPASSPPAASFEIDPEAYSADAWSPADRASFTKLGIVRGVDLYLLEIRPVAYNPVRGGLMVWPEMQAELRFSNVPSDTPMMRSALLPRRLLLNPPNFNPLSSRDSGNFLIVTAQTFSGSAPLTQFVNAKTSQGFNVTVYTATPGTSRATIKSYIQGLWGGANSPDYLLIIGDATGRNINAESAKIPMWGGGGAYGWDTDLPYSCMDGEGDWYADIAMARWPLRTVTDLQNIVTKTLVIENGTSPNPSYSTRALFLAHTDPEANAETTHDDMIKMYMEPNNIQATKLYASQGATTVDVANGFNGGAFLATYIGHSTVSEWYGPAFGISNVNALTNSGMYPFVMSYSCGVGVFNTLDEYDPVLLEHFLRVADKGAATCYGPLAGNYYPWSTWTDMYRCVMAAIYEDGIREMGNTCQAAKLRFVTMYGHEAPVSRDYVECFELLGDPSLHLPVPPQANYLIVTAPTYVNSTPLNQLIAQRQARNFNVIVYNVPSGTSNTAIKTYIRSLWGTASSPNYVVIIGDTNGSTSTSTTIPHFVGLGYRQGTTDWPYVCMDSGDDWYPEIPIGRLSVQNVTQLQAVVDKTLKVESGNFTNPDYVKRGTFLANSSSDVSTLAQSTHNWVIDTYFTPNGYSGTKVYGALGGTTAQVAASVNQGSMWTVYMGHSADTGWWNPAFYQSDINALTNDGLYGVAMGWSCHTAQYELSECSGETWLRAADKGAAAYISASQYIYWGSNENWEPSVVCEKSYFRSVFEDGLWELGPGWLNGMYRFLKDYGGWDGVQGHVPPLHEDKCRDFMEEFVILGDPALLLPQPYGFALGSNPASVSVCSPPNNQAAYTIQVQAQGGFAESVTLTAGSLPTGASAQFSIPQQVPPFGSILTVSNLQAVNAGQYTIMVNGVSATKQRSIPVTLIVSHGISAAPVLSTPVNGATGVSRSPTLTWQAASGAIDYDVQIARDSGFSNIVYSSTVTGTSDSITSSLLASTQYFWRVRSGNACGDGSYSSPFSFTTITQTDYFTQEFTGSSDPFDMDNFSITFTPDGSGSFYRMCGDAATQFPTDPTGGTPVSLADDGSIQISPGQPVLLYGQSYGSFYLNANGNITFGSGDSTWTESLSVHFSRARISALFDDLYPPGGGTISWKRVGDHVAVTWQNVPQVSSSDQNTFQIEMFTDGKIRFTWLRVDSLDSIVGLSRGLGVPSDFTEDNLSGALTCFVYGACCRGQTCTIETETACTSSGGQYKGDNTNCTINPCIDYNEACVIISEVVDGTLSGGCPKFIEITNTAATDFVFLEGGVIVQADGSSDTTVDVNLTGVSIPAGQSIVVDSNQGQVCTGAFQAMFGFPPDVETSFLFGDGNDRYILTDKANGSNLLDTYGEFGVNGNGRPWEYTGGFAYRLPAYNAGQGQQFVPYEWHYGGVGSLGGPYPEGALLANTTPGEHMFAHACPSGAGVPADVNCDTIVDVQDVAAFALALVNQAAYVAQYPGCTLANADLDSSGVIDGRDMQLFVNELLNK